MKKILLLLGCTLLLMASCTKKYPDVYKATLIYIIGDNNLSDEFITNVKELEKGVTGKEDGRIFVFLDTDGRGQFPTPVLLEIQPTKNSGKIDSKVIRTYNKIDACDVSTIDIVMDDIKMIYPECKVKNMLLSSHGSSWVPVHTSMNRSPAENSFGVDDSSNSEFDIIDLGNKLKSFGFETLIFDGCFMGGIETLYEMRFSANYIIASPAVIFEYGFPYKTLASHFADADISPDYVTSAYYDYYEHIGGTIMYANCKELENLANETKKIISQNYSSLNNPELINGLFSYSFPKSYFVYDFKQYMNKIAGPNIDLTAFNSAWNKAIKLYKHTPYIQGMDLKGTFGLTFYAPMNQVDANYSIPYYYNDYYKTLSWGKESGFALFIQ